LCNKAAGCGLSDRKSGRIRRIIVYAVFLLCASLATASPVQTTFRTLVNLGGTTGEYPQYISLIQGTDGNFYGTTSYGGGPNGGGTVFRVTAAGTLTIVYSFCVQTYCPDGAEPYGGLAQGPDGNFYGTTFYGGDYYDGAVFRVTPQGKLTVLHSFKGSDGSNPIAGVAQAKDGAFYGTTSGLVGGGYGTVFKITPNGKFTTLHNFDGSDGAEPYDALVQAANGVLYGTTLGGGGGGGTIFKIAPRGKLTTLHIFGSTDGFYPYGGLLQATDGNFYGTTSGGGYRGDRGAGTVFKITARGKLTTLHSFRGSPFEGAAPYAGLVQASDGNFYGTTVVGGAKEGCNGNPCGTIFKITSRGKLTTLYNFCSKIGCSDGYAPYGGLVQGTDGTFYGTTFRGGTSSDCNNGFGTGCGTVFSLDVGLGPFVETRPTSGKVGAEIIILGTNLTGATAVTFHGRAAKFKVVSKSEITAQVPKGATTDKVKVKTPTGTVMSNVAFRVTN
jgi:uncharacterized repeat protein (TIGR03803 family)